MIKIGQGFDVHAFSTQAPENGQIVLGGVFLPSHRAIKAHSDGDVVLHALCDSLLGALGLGDIGDHFSDTDAAYANMDSAWFVRQVMLKMQTSKFRVINADITIIAESPKITPYKTAMAQRISELLDVLPAQINVKATTFEKLGALGREEGIAAQAVVLIQGDAS